VPSPKPAPAGSTLSSDRRPSTTKNSVFNDHMYVLKTTACKSKPHKSLSFSQRLKTKKSETTSTAGGYSSQAGPAGDPSPLAGPAGDPSPLAGPAGDPSPRAGPAGDPSPRAGPPGDPSPRAGPPGDPSPVAGSSGVQSSLASSRLAAMKAKWAATNDDEDDDGGVPLSVTQVTFFMLKYTQRF